MQIQQETLFALEEVPQALQPFVDSQALAAALAAPVLALDIETDTQYRGLGPQNDYGLSYVADVTVIALAWPDSSHEGGIGSTVLVGPFPQDVLQTIAQRFGESRFVIAHNAVFDMRGMGKLLGGIVPVAIWDTQAMARLLHGAKQSSFSLLHVAAALGVPFSQRQAAMKNKRDHLHKLSAQLLIEYAAEDAVVTLKIYEAQQPYITDASDYSLAELECEAMRVYCQMAARGVRLNETFAKSRIEALAALTRECLDRLRAQGLHNPGSPQQRAKYIYETQGLPKPDKDETGFYTKGGALSTSVDVIEALIDRYPEHAAKLSDLSIYLDADRMMATLVSLCEHAALDGRIHSLLTIGTQTGRRSAAHPQVQNWKMVSDRDDPAGDMAGIALADDGFSLVEIDYSNAENWLAALLSGDNNFAAACSAEDFHSAMAAQYFKGEWESADKDRRKALRRMGKSVTFGTAYGMGAAKLARTLGIEKGEAERILQAKDRAFADVAAAKKAAMGKASSEGYVTLWTGRRVQVDKNQVYVAWNYVNQGGVGEMIKRSIVGITHEYEARGFRSRVALDQHDALVLEVAHDEWNEALGIASRIMQTVIPAELNTRTNPPIKWIAQPNMAENAKKWGKFQQHFDYQPVEAPTPQLDAWYQTGVAAYQLGRYQDTYLIELADEGKRPNQAELEAYRKGYAEAASLSDFEADQRTEDTTTRVITFPELLPGFSYTVQGFSRANWQAFFEALMDRAEAEFDCVNPTCPPVLADGAVSVGPQESVSLYRWWMVAEAWAHYARQGVDTVELVGLSLEELEAAAQQRRERVQGLAKLIELAGDFFTGRLEGLS